MAIHPFIQPRYLKGGILYCLIILNEREDRRGYIHVIK